MCLKLSRPSIKMVFVYFLVILSLAVLPILGHPRPSKNCYSDLNAVTDFNVDKVRALDTM